MSLADCLQKIPVDPADVAAIQTVVEEKIQAGLDKDTAEKEAVAEHLAAVQAQVEDLRQQLGAPAPVDIPAPSMQAIQEAAGSLADQHLTELFQAVSLRKGNETLRKYGLKPDGKYTTRQVAAALEARQREKYGSIAADDRSDEAKSRIAKWMADEVAFELENPEKSGAGWYSTKFQKALDLFGNEFPELKTDKNARDTFTLLVAITSNGEKVFTNFNNAADIYSNFRQTGRFEMTRGSARQAETLGHLQRMQELFDRMGAEEASKWLLQEKTVSELKKLAKEQGIDFSSDYQAHIKLPMAAVAIGPKLGAFYANLMGAEGYLTMDRWWSRTFNRYRGNLLTKPTRQGLDRLKSLLGNPELSDDEALSATVAYRESYEAKGFKNGTELEKAANTIYKDAFVGLEDIPFNATDRTFMLETVKKAKGNLKRRGMDVSVADIQAILWYFEKRLYGELGARDSADVSYEEAAARVVAERAGQPLPPVAEQTKIGEEPWNPREGAQISTETRPGAKSGLLPGIAGASFEQLQEFHDAVMRVFIDEKTGKDKLASLVGLDVTGSALVTGVWGDQNNPSTQITAKGDASKLSSYSALFGLLTGQDAVAWHKPDWTEEVESANGVEVRVGRTLTLDEMKAMVKALEDVGLAGIPVIGSAEGVRLLNFSGKPNTEFHNLAKKAAEKATGDDFDFDRFKSDGDYVESNKEGEPYGQGYRSRLDQEGRSEALRAAESEFGPRIAEVHRDFAERYGWNDPATHRQVELHQASKKSKYPRTIKDAVSRGKPFKLIHWSSSADLESLDPSFAGTAGAGEELAKYSQGLKKRVWFGLLGRYARESMLGSYAYELTVKPEQVYDLYADRLGLVRQASEKFGTEIERRNWTEQQAGKKGFKFFYSSKEGPWGPVLYAISKVDGIKPIENVADLIKPDMPDATEEEYRRYAYEQAGVREVGAEELGSTFESRREFFQAAHRKAAIRGAVDATGRNPQEVAAEERALRERQKDVDPNAPTERIVKKEAKPVEQGGEAVARGRLEITSDQYLISLFDGADLSTVLHEMGHIFLEEMSLIVATGAASEQTVKDMAALNEWFGGDFASATPEEAKRMHEQFASNFEAYLMRGKAPTKALRSAFNTFRRWITKIYGKVVPGNAIAGLEQVAQQNTPGLKVNLTPSVIEVFDRLLTLEGEAAGALLDSEHGTVVDPKNADSEDEQTAAARERAVAAAAEARRKVEDTLFEHRTRIIDENRETWEKEAREAVAAMPVYRALKSLANNPLDGVIISDRYGEPVVKELFAKKLIAGEETQLGNDPDIAAVEFGFESGSDLIAALRTAPSQEAAVQQMVRSKAEEAWSEFDTDTAIAATPEYLASMAAAGEYFAMALGQRPTDPRDIRDSAREALSEMTVAEATDVKKFLQTMARMQRQERLAAKEGRYDDALAKNRLARKNLEMAREARKIRDEVDAVKKRMEKLRTVKLGTVEFNYHVNALVIAVRHGMLDPSVLRLPGVDKVPGLRAILSRSVDPASDTFEPAMDVLTGFSDELIDGRLVDEKGRPLRFDAMKVDQLFEADHLVRFLEKRGRDLVDDKILEGKTTAEDAAGEILKPLSGLKDKKVFEEGSLAARAMKWVDGYVASLSNWQFVVRRMDGATNIGKDGIAGPAEQYLYDPLHKASSKRSKMFSDLMKALEKPMSHFAKRMREFPKYIDNGVPVTEAMRQKGRTGWTFENVLAAALNMGNDYNMEALAKGFGWTLDDGQPNLGRLRILTQVLTEEDWQQVQSIWDAVNSLWPGLSEVFERRNGFPLAKVEATPLEVKTSDGKTVKLAGGYYPVKFDTTLSDRAAEQSEMDDLKNAAGGLFPLVGTKSGMTKKRSNTGGKPLLLSLGGLSAHLRDTVQYITMSEVVVDVYRIAKDPAFKAGFIEKFGEAQYRNIRKMLADIGLPEPGNIDMWDKALNGLRGAATAWVLGLNLGTAFKQSQAFFNFAAEQGWSSVGSGLKAVGSMGWSEAVAQMKELSPFMSERYLAADREVIDALKGVDWLNKPKLKKVQDAMFYPIQVMDRTTATIMWWGAYTGHLKAGMAPAESALAADKDIAFTVPGAPRALDQNALLRDKRGWMRLLTSFSTATFHFANRQMFYAQAWRDGNVSAGQVGYRMLVEGIASPLAVIAVMGLLWGNWPPDKEELKKTGLDLFAYQFSGFPFLREMLNAGLNQRKFGESVPTFSGLDLATRLPVTLYKMVEDMGDEKKAGRALQAFADLISFIYKVPVSKVIGRITEGWRQIDEFPNDDKALEWLNDVFTLLIPDPDKRGKR